MGNSSSSSSAVRPAVTSVEAAPRGDRAEDLLAERFCEETPLVSHDADEAAGEGEETAQEEVCQEGQVVNLEDADAALDAVLSQIDDGVEALSALLGDNAAFYEACEAAWPMPPLRRQRPLMCGWRPRRS